MLMSFLGSIIGKVKSGSALVEALQWCYRTNTISHMLSGKAVKQAVRGHYLMDSALRTILLEKLIKSAEGHKGTTVWQVKDQEDLRTLYSNVVQHRIDSCEPSKSATLS